MRLLISYNGVMKIYPNAEQYDDMATFIKGNFPNLNSSYTVNYKDCDDDLVSLSSQLDMEVMNDTATGKYIKVFVEDDFDSQNNQKAKQEQKISMIKASQIKNLVQETQMEIQQPMEPIFDFSQQQPERVEAKHEIFHKMRQLQNLQDAKCQKSNWWSEEQIKQWKQKEQTKFADLISTQVQKKIQILLPNIVKEVAQSLKISKESQQKCQKPFKLSKCKQGGLKDIQLTLTKKCFKLMNIFGGQMDDYKEFVSDHLMEPISDIIQKYHKKNPESLQDFVGAKIVNCTKKLGFYFDEKPQQFMTIAKKNPELNFVDLVKIVKAKKIEEQMNGKKIQKVEEQKIEIKKEQMIKLSKSQKTKKPSELKEIPKLQIKPDAPKDVNVQVPIDNPVKKDHVILTLKDYFGPEKTFEFVRFYDQNRQYEAEQIIQKYCDLQFKN